jgi:hypothetical protein
MRAPSLAYDAATLLPNDLKRPEFQTVYRAQSLCGAKDVAASSPQISDLVGHTSFAQVGVCRAQA